MQRSLLPEWRYWPAIPLAALLAIAIFGFVSQLQTQVSPEHYIAQNFQYKQVIPKKDNESVFSEIGHWAYANRETIGALCAIGALFMAAILALVTGLLWKATDNLATSTAGLRDAAHEQSSEMRKAGELAAKQFDLAEKQFLLAGRQCDLAEKQHGLQRAQYLAEHGPRIEIRSVGLRASGSGGLMFQPGFPIVASLVVVNAGESDAVIRQTEYRFFMSPSDLPMVPPLRPGDAKPLLADVPHRMSGHESCFVEIESHALLAHQAQEFRTGGPCQLYIMGAILYSDWDLKERWMGFCRKYVAPVSINGEGRFVQIDNPDYEYQD